MANGGRYDEDTQYDPFDPDEDDFQMRHWNEQYETLEGVQSRHMENMIDDVIACLTNMTSICAFPLKISLEHISLI